MLCEHLNGFISNLTLKDNFPKISDKDIILPKID